MQQQYIIGTDIGTTGAKTTVFSMDGKVVSSAYREYTCDYPRPLWVEQDAIVLRDSAMQTIKEALHKASAPPESIVSIGFSTQRSCALFLDGNGVPLKMISWQDSRCDEILDRIRDVTSEEEFYKLSGLPLGNTWVLPKIMWIRENDAELYRKTVRIVQLHDYILKEFGADEYVTPETDAGMTGFFDVDNYLWADNYLELFDIDKGMLPVVRQVGERIGTISDAVADMTGLPRGLPLFTGIGDVSSAAVGAGIVSAGDLLVSMGTGGIMVVCTDKPMRDPNSAFLITDHAIHGMWQWEGLQKGSAGCYRWYRDVIATDEKNATEARGEDAYVELDKRAKEIPPGSNGLLVMPYFASAGTPRWDAWARGCILGLTFAHDKYHIARAFMEGVALEYRDMLESLRRSGFVPGAISVSGGSAKSDVWNSIQADIYNTPVQTLAFPDASVLGAVITCAVGAGVYGSIPEAVSELVKKGKTYEPDSENARIYDDLYHAYVQAYEGLSQGAFKSLSAF
ncbi:MAG: FGGY family carbohydrate kinase [Clostridiales bacterium]|nr:FGGY family carbohydrate kinase [Clostridiales bacterium]